MYLRFDAVTELGVFKRTAFLCISVLRVASGPKEKLAGCKSALTQSTLPATMVHSTDRSKALAPVLVLRLLCGLLYEAICFKPCLVLSVFCPLSIAITSLGEERANLNAFPTI